MKTDFKLLLSKLVENKFDSIIVGGFAAAAYGSSYVTHDLDVCAVLSPENMILSTNWYTPLRDSTKSQLDISA